MRRGRSRSRSFRSSASSTPSDAASSAAGEVRSRETSFSGCGSGRTRSSQRVRKPPRRSAPLELVEAAQRARAEQLAVALVEAAEHGHPEPLAREPERIARLQRLLEQRRDVPLAHAHVDAVDERDELLRRRHDRDLDRARDDLAQPRIALERARRPAPPRARPRSRRRSSVTARCSTASSPSVGSTCET